MRQLLQAHLSNATSNLIGEPPNLVATAPERVAAPVRTGEQSLDKTWTVDLPISLPWL